MARTSVYGFDRAQVDGYERIRAQVAFLAQQLGFSIVDIEKLEAHEQNFQIVQITNAVAASDGTYTGQIVIDKGGSFESTQDCRVRAVSGTLSVGKTYLARQSGYDGASAVFTVFDSPLFPGSYYDWIPSVANWTTHPGGSAGPVEDYNEIHTFTAMGEAGFVITLPDLSNSIQTPIHVRVCVGKLDGGSIGIDPGVVTTNGIQGAGPSVLYNITTPWTGYEFVSDYYNGNGWLVM
jgi:hypothetical protein